MIWVTILAFTLAYFVAWIIARRPGGAGWGVLGFFVGWIVSLTISGWVGWYGMGDDGPDDFIRDGGFAGERVVAARFDDFLNASFLPSLLGAGCGVFSGRKERRQEERRLSTRLSATRRTDTAELTRVDPATPATSIEAELADIRKLIAHLERRVADLRADRDNLRHDCEHWRQQAESTARLLAAPKRQMLRRHE